jgi:aspartyl-tRNA(Asn)/glutamyl-tRNA(Gln) amidotransferase subunit C
VAITHDDVRHVAVLSRLDVTDEEVARYTDELTSIFGHIEQLNKLDTEGVAPTSRPLPMQNVFRADEVRPPLTPEAALANAPEQLADCFKVPQIL